MATLSTVPTMNLLILIGAVHGVGSTGFHLQAGDSEEENLWLYAKGDVPIPADGDIVKVTGKLSNGGEVGHVINAVSIEVIGNVDQTASTEQPAATQDVLDSAPAKEPSPAPSQPSSSTPPSAGQSPVAAPKPAPVGVRPLGVGGITGRPVVPALAGARPVAGSAAPATGTPTAAAPPPATAAARPAGTPAPLVRPGTPLGRPVMGGVPALPQRTTPPPAASPAPATTQRQQSGQSLASSASTGKGVGHWNQPQQGDDDIPW